MKKLLMVLSLAVLAGCASKEKAPICSVEGKGKVANWELRAATHNKDPKKIAYDKLSADLKSKKISQKTFDRKTKSIEAAVMQESSALAAEFNELQKTHPACFSTTSEPSTKGKPCGTDCNCEK